MFDNFKSISISFRDSSLDEREQLALNEDSTKKVLNAIKEILNLSDVLVLSTCNRTEIYYTNDEDLSEELIKLLCIAKGVENSSAFLNRFKRYTDHNEAVTHLFNVSMGLEAQVVGDLQISGQIKNAYQWSADLDMAGPFLHRLMHAIFFTNKRVVQETSFRDGAASVSYATAELVEELGSVIKNPKILLIGLGEIGKDATRNLAEAKSDDVTVMNRTESKAQSLAEECGFNTRPFSELWEAINDSDIIISSVNSVAPIITFDKVKEQEILSFKYFIDLSVPRSVENEVDDIPGAIVYNIDDIQNRASEALDKRLAAIPDVKSIISEAITEFSSWAQELEVSPTIKKLKNALEQIRKEEISRYMKNLSDDEVQKVEKITQNITQKIIKLPVLELKAACKRGEAETLIDVLNDLFNLDQEETPKVK